MSCSTSTSTSSLQDLDSKIYPLIPKKLSEINKNFFETSIEFLKKEIKTLCSEIRPLENIDPVLCAEILFSLEPGDFFITPLPKDYFITRVPGNYSITYLNESDKKFYLTYLIEEFGNRRVCHEYISCDQNKGWIIENKKIELKTENKIASNSEASNEKYYDCVRPEPASWQEIHFNAE